MGQLRATKRGLLVGAAACVCVFLYLRSSPPEAAQAEPPYPAALECGFYPDELCSALFEGKKAAPQIATFCTNQPAPDILGYVHDAGNCSRMSRGLRFITTPLSAEEGNFSLAYIVTLREELAMFVQLLRAIYAPQNLYCIHVDGTAPREYTRAVRALAACFGNIFISPRTQEAAHTDRGRLQADIDCMKDLVQSKRRWKYVINLCGQDFPIKTNREIIHYLRSKWNDKNITPGVASTGQARARPGPGPPEPSPGGGHASPTEGFGREPPHNVTVYVGSAYYLLTRRFVEFVLTDGRAKDVLQWARATLSPAQHYWGTLNRLKDAPGSTPDAGWEGNLRAVKRRAEEGKVHDGCKGHYVQDTCVYGPGDLAWLIQSPSLFASKFAPSSEPLVVTCLERRHRLRVLAQAEVPTQPHWHFQPESHFNMKLRR
ncbi:beta-1,3-galactosyl-O-glycosyl-glycoprotein beta-1,6-N-acetylglucosaminyltransferase 7-like [Perognathus longimembris pacificus]|uniref:beta-1,3-galactosyl-O-glycosyl-glycoprotein beta-1,6-N-acetylglucosaminyltransferase 7-like n=1 Tax=Perognathus longimembris pacificus TaxID=214514 RepID=UPI0020186375|nr:beta-1,3-galactosyl-O-glycosyl-glycoprotein beta-1,6-N-acetylglucosaminyltransferase 7-like [Perognathus longimembris pacificus]